MIDRPSLLALPSPFCPGGSLAEKAIPMVLTPFSSSPFSFFLSAMWTLKLFRSCPVLSNNLYALPNAMTTGVLSSSWSGDSTAKSDKTETSKS